MTSNPVSTGTLRDFWGYSEELTEQQRGLLLLLPHSLLEELLDDEFNKVSVAVIKDICQKVTEVVLKDIPDTNAPTGEKDQCSECKLPITSKGGGQWRDDIMGSDTCPNGKPHIGAEHAQALERALGEVSDMRARKEARENPNVATTHIPTGGKQLLLTISEDSDESESGNLFYASFVLVDVDPDDATRVAQLRQHLNAQYGATMVDDFAVSFKAGRSTAADDLFDKGAAEIAQRLTVHGFPAVDLTTFNLEREQ